MLIKEIKKRMTFEYRFLYVIFLLVFLWPEYVFAEPPFLTDDADPADLHEVEVYPFIFVISANDESNVFAPALEIDYGFIKDAEVQLVIPVLTTLPDHGEKATGLSDLNLNIKYRFLNETRYLPEIAIVPTVILPTGNVDRGLGNGRLWTQLPIWIEKHLDKWTIYTGGGYGFNSAPNQKTYAFGGFLVEREVSEKFVVGGEIFLQGSTVNHTSEDPDDGHVNLLNFGGEYQFSKSTAMIFSFGHSIGGVNQWIGFFGFHWSKIF